MHPDLTLDASVDAPPAPVDEPAESGLVGKLTGSRRSFIKGVAAAGASTMAAYAIDGSGLDLFTDEAVAQAPNAFSNFRAIPASPADALQVPEGYRADLIIGYGDRFAAGDGTSLLYGYNNDFLAFFPLPAGSESSNEGVLFVNHEYPGPYLQHGETDARAKTLQQIELERESVGISILHVRRDDAGVFRVVSPSSYNRRITGAVPVECEFTGPLADNPAYPGVGLTVRGSLANCSGGTTPWGTALSCEENYQDYASTGGNFGYGWTGPSAPNSKPTTDDEGNQTAPPPASKLDTDDYYNGDGTAASPPTPGQDFGPQSDDPDTLRGPAKYGWVVEVDPYDPTYTPRKHTALGRFRHENTAFNAQPGKPFVLYMGDDRTNGAVYKFVSDRAYVPGGRDNNERILESGTLYIARWEPGGRRTFAKRGDTVPTSATQGTGTWRKVEVDELRDTHRLIRASVGIETFDQFFATNRPEDVEVDTDGTVFIALTNNLSVNDSFGSIRTLNEGGDDPTSTGPFTWVDFAAGGPPDAPAGDQRALGFASPDNLAFDRAGNIWVVTDISSSALNAPGNPNEFHGNNAAFMIPMKPDGQRADVAYRFANGPIQAELTGPYFTPDERTLFLNVQHPGEESDSGRGDDNAAANDTLTSFWPRGNRTTGQNPSNPIPSMVTVTKLAPSAPPAPTAIPAPPPGRTPEGTPAPAADRALPAVFLLGRGRQQIETLRGRGMSFEIQVDEPVTIVATLRGRLTSRRRRRGRPSGRGRERRVAQTTLRNDRPGRYTLRLRPSAALRTLLRRETRMPAALLIRATDRAGNVRTRRKRVDFV